MVSEYLYSAKIEFPSGMASHSPLSWDELGGLLSGYLRTYGPSVSVSLALCEPFTLGAHGKHRMDDGKPLGRGVGSSLGGSEMVSNRSNAISEHQECLAACTCGIGPGTLVHAHFPGCAVGSYPSNARVHVLATDGTGWDSLSMGIQDPTDDGKGPDAAD